MVGILEEVRGQRKFESEKRIGIQLVPEAALSYVESLGFQTKIKWYEEVSQQGISYEAKTRSKGIRYSIEFDEKGQLQDVEFIRKFNQLEPEIQENIKSSLSDQFNRHKITRIQTQWTGTTLKIREAILSRHWTDALTTRYELVIKGKRDGKYSSFEILYDSLGNPVRSMEIADRSSLHLDF